MKELLKAMLTGWVLHENSWDPEKQRYTRDKTGCMIEACGGDVIKGSLLELFDYWSNDIQSLSPHYGLELRRNDKNELYIDENIPPAPSAHHYWDTEGREWCGLPSKNNPSKDEDDVEDEVQS